MPTYDFQCQKEGCGRTVEKILSVADRHNSGPCPECGSDMERIYISRREAAQRFDPIVVHVDPKTGAFRVPGAGDARVPDGFERRELRTIREIEKFESQANRYERSRSDMAAHRENMREDAVMGPNRSDLRRMMQHMSPAGRDLARVAMEQNAKRRRQAYDCGVHFEVLHQDRSNREEHRDVRTNWKRGRD
ncbi:MAG: zinc ribbon domain-containing protein [Planctomycetaceae bacterium]